ncbi:MAG: hypothetical protein HYX78_00250 [Armatimonadetes bacterium]|nr:hypothetical protein [Armatimonadota bacterium]
MRRYIPLAVALGILLIIAAAYALTAASRAQQIGGVSVGEVIVNDQVPLRIRYSAGGLSPAERASTVARRLNQFENLQPSEITVGMVRGQWAVLARGDLLVTADPAHAIANDTTTYGLALSWRNQLRAAVAGQQITPPPAGAGPADGLPAANVRTAQKVVPILSVGSGLRVGAALVAGSSSQVGKVNAVAQLEGDFRDSVRVRALVPVDTENVIGSIRRVPGTAVIAVADVRL